MIYYNIDVDTEPKITGNRNGVFSVEIKHKNSFGSIDDKNVWKNYLSENRENKNRILLNNYVPFDNSRLNYPINFFPVGRKIKQLDFIAFSPYIRGIQFLATRRVYEIISKYRLPIHSIIPSKIDTFDESYYLIGFPMLAKSAYDFNKSTFFDYRHGRPVKFKDYEDYKNANYDRITSTPQKLYLREKIDFDIIITTKGAFFLLEIIEDFEKENITGYRRIEGILEN